LAVSSEGLVEPITELELVNAKAEKVISQGRELTPETDDHCAEVHLDLKSDLNGNKVALLKVSAPQMVFDEISEDITRRVKVDLPENLQDTACSHCGFLRCSIPSEAIFGAFDPTESKWYCYLCWRQFRRDIYELSVPNIEGTECYGCAIYLLPNQGRAIDLGNDNDQAAQRLYCMFCWKSWINSLPCSGDWLGDESIEVRCSDQILSD